MLIFQEKRGKMEEIKDGHNLREVSFTKERPQNLINDWMKQKYCQSYNISIFNDEFIKELARTHRGLRVVGSFGMYVHISGATALSNRRQAESRSWCLE